jgi:hypothetical protein
MTNEFKKEMRYCPKCQKMETRSECAYGPSYWDKYAEPVKQEDAPVNSVGTGAVAGIGVGPNGEPGVNKKKKLTPFMSFIKRKSIQ